MATTDKEDFDSPNQPESTFPGPKTHVPRKGADVQKNTEEEFPFLCKVDPEHPGELRCRPVKGMPVLSGKNKSRMGPDGSYALEPKVRGGKLSLAGKVETWRRPNGTTIRVVRRLQADGNEVFFPLKEGPRFPAQDRHVPPSSTTRNNAVSRREKTTTECEFCTDDSKDSGDTGKEDTTPKRE
jgi:hypothetical protein